MKELELIEGLCNRFMLASEATGLSKAEFGKLVGLSSQQMSNIKVYRNPPSHFAIALACKQFGFTTDYFYTGSMAGMRDQDLPGKLRAAQAKLGTQT